MVSGLSRRFFSSMRRSVGVALALAVVPQLATQNSTKKLRAEPSAMAARVGSAVQWRTDLAGALAESATSGKPVFWYVPSVVGSPMDRKREIDRYMRAGPFTWTTTVELLNDAFVPLALVPDRELQRRFGLAPREFVEPGYLVLDAEGTVLRRLDAIVTFAREWFEAPLVRLVAREPAVWRDTEASRAFDAGVAKWRTGDRAGALAIWREVAQRFPDDPYGWKAAAEVEGHGPLLRGFEVVDALPDAVLDDVSAVHAQAPAGCYDEDQLWRRGVEFLLRMRDEHGGIVDSTYDFGGTDSLPNVHVACTALAASAVLEARLRAGEPLDAGFWTLYDYATDDARLAEADRDEIVWAHIYRARLCARLLHAATSNETLLGVDRGTAPRRHLRAAIDALVGLQPEHGMWFHEYANPFVTASVLVALRTAANEGVQASSDVVERGLKSLLSARTAEGAYSYGQPRAGRPPRATLVAASGRMPLGELALLVWQQADETRLLHALDTAFAHHAELEAVRKYDDHANEHGHGGFFFWFDMQARCEAIERIQDAKQRAEYAARQRELILGLPEIDGCFVDSHELGRSYGTAMALGCLAACARAMGG